MEAKLLSDVQQDIKTGDLLAFTVRRYGTLVSFVLWLYQKITKVTFSHVGIAVWVGDRLFIVEAVAPRVAMTPISKVKEFYLIPANIEKASEDVMISFLMDYIEVKYSIIDFITYYLGMDYSDDKIYCSTLASAFYYHVGYLHERDSGHTPQKITKAVMKRGGVDKPIYVVTDRGNL